MSKLNQTTEVGLPRHQWDWLGIRRPYVSIVPPGDWSSLIASTGDNRFSPVLVITVHSQQTDILRGDKKGNQIYRLSMMNQCIQFPRSTDSIKILYESFEKVLIIYMVSTCSCHIACNANAAAVTYIEDSLYCIGW